ncbi:TPA: hypothetical protein N0F65_006551 [Lagenidium giganteum]|uniref:BZIP domain-containing protein n=1 Tax=Lagenidium giganteum TaxID=4803 RepID=A0AAV2YNB8_9STRA|nr:TPA: hypothetical protein N0F65_006551 [Lagenidium giganteum]
MMDLLVLPDPADYSFELEEARRVEVRRIQNRQAMRKFRAKKQHQREEMQELIHQLEAKLAGLSEEKGVNAQDLISRAQNEREASASALRKLNKQLADIHQVAYVLREEKVWLERELHNHSRALTSLRSLTQQATPLSVVHVQERGFEWANDVLPFLPSMTSDSNLQELIRQSYADVTQAALASYSCTDVANDLLGWSDKRVVRDSELQFMFTKDFTAQPVDQLVQKTWMVTSNVKEDPRIYFMTKIRHVKVLRRINDNALIVARNMHCPYTEPSDLTFHTIYLRAGPVHKPGWRQRFRDAITVFRYPGQYSVEKLHALHAYSEHSSTKRDMAWILLSPLPCLVGIILLQLIPLHGPTHSPKYIPELGLKWTQIVGIGICLSLSFTGTIVVFWACTGWFPVPFSIAIPLPVMVGTGCILTYMLMRHRIVLIPKFYERFRNTIILICTKTAPIFIYPIYATIFSNISGGDQVIFSFVLPILKLFILSITWRKVQYLEDISPALVAFSVHLFHSLFVAVCLQSSKSPVTYGVLLTINFVQCIVSSLLMSRDTLNLRLMVQGLTMMQSAKRTQRDVNRGALVRLASQHLHRASIKLRQAFNSPPPSSNTSALPDLIGSLLMITERDFERLHPFDYIQWLSSYHRYTNRTIACFQAFRNETRENPVVDWASYQSSKNSRYETTRSRASMRNSVRRSSAKVLPVALLATAGSAIRFPVQEEASFIADVMIQMYHHEFILLRLYVGTIAPIMYIVFMWAMLHFPNRQFYTTMVNLTDKDALRITFDLLAYVAVEFIALLTHLYLMRRRWGVSGLSQLAFVLSTQVPIVQSMLCAYTVAVFSFPLEQAGNDFSFRFEWIHHPNGTRPGNGTGE